MEKIPVGQTIARAYTFAFRDFFKVLSIMWLPFVALSLFTLSLQGQFTALTGAMQVKNTQALGPTAWIVIFPAFVIIMLLLFMQIVGISQQALGLRKGSPYYYFWVGQPLWKLIGSYLLVLLLMIAVAIVLVMGGALLGAITAGVNAVSGGGKPTGGIGALLSILTVIGALIAYCAFIYIFLRMTFLLTPTVVAEGKLGLGRAWALGKGNFWRMFTIFLSVVIPIVVIEIVTLFGIVWRGMPPLATQGATPEQIAAWHAANMERLTSEWYITFPLFFVVSVVFYGVAVGAQSFAYRALVPAEKAEDVF
jgi:hypothetical protein